MDDNHLPTLIQRKIFSDALQKGREALRKCRRERRRATREAARAWSCATEAKGKGKGKAKTRRHGEARAKSKASRRRAAAAAADAEFANMLEQDLRKAREAHDRAEEAEYLRLLGEDMKRAQAAHRRAVDEEFARLLAEDRRKAQEAQRQAQEEAARKEREREKEKERRRQEEEEKRRRKAEEEEEEEERRRKAAEEEERGRRAEHEDSVCKEKGREHPFFFPESPPLTGPEGAYVQAYLEARLGIYEEKWAVLRNTAIVVRPLHFRDVPWPSFGKVLGVEDITVERVQEFVCHLHGCVQGSPTAKAIRSEMVRWHPDKIGRVLDRVVKGDHEAVTEAAGNVARILTQLREVC